MLSRSNLMRCVLCLIGLTASACGPRARIPPRPLGLLPGTLARDESAARLARSLAPVLFLQRDEWFALERVVAVVHPTRRVIGYHLLWRDDVHGSWIPFTVPTDQEIVWVGYDNTFAPTEVWTFWHGTILHTPWNNRGPSTVNVQWGKHGSLPRGTIESDLPRFKSLNAYYLFSWIGMVDMWLGKLTRPGPGCFCYGYDRYREFSKPLVIADRLDVVARTAEPRDILKAVFGSRYSQKRAWPAAARE